MTALWVSMRHIIYWLKLLNLHASMHLPFCLSSICHLSVEVTRLPLWIEQSTITKACAFRVVGPLSVLIHHQYTS